MGFLWWPPQGQGGEERRLSALLSIQMPSARSVDNASLAARCRSAVLPWSLSLSCVPLFAVRTRQQNPFSCS